MVIQYKANIVDNCGRRETCEGNTSRNCSDETQKVI